MTLLKKAGDLIDHFAPKVKLFFDDTIFTGQDLHVNPENPVKVNLRI